MGATWFLLMREDAALFVLVFFSFLSSLAVSTDLSEKVNYFIMDQLLHFIPPSFYFFTTQLALSNKIVLRSITSCEYTWCFYASYMATNDTSIALNQKFTFSKSRYCIGGVLKNDFISTATLIFFFCSNDRCYL